jgi:sugar phosphate isomerase/epimerase
MIAGREIALAHLTVLDATPAELVEIAAAAGFDAVTLRPGDAPVGPEVRDRGVRVLDVEYVRLRAETDVAAARPLFEIGAELGARHVLAVGEEPDENRMVACFAALCAEAEPYGLVPVLEFMPFTAVRTVAQADRIVAAAGAGGVLVDPLHLRRSGGSPDEVAALAAAHPERYPYAQLCDAPLARPRGSLLVEAVRARRLPGAGELPLAEVLAALPPGVPLSVEVPGPGPAGLERAREALAATRALLESTRIAA